ncbi:heme exporter protein CcmD [Pelagibacterium limicola]|uniref:heme exporter protein CcmD n=1 Tax=Pelagibacterium limicola TaxID=2791022 RepID=UPI0018AFFF79|nr:heme exporter protein CcmD [Pelagibacterium limicola]
MIALGQHWEFIMAAYLGCFAVVGALIGWTVLDGWRARARAATLEAQREQQRAARS